MNTLFHMQCVPCHGDEPAVTDEEIAEHLHQIPDWNLTVRNGIKKLERQFIFKDYSQTLAFSMQVGMLAEEDDHHPEILIEWGKVTITWWTHSINDLHLNDFILAAKTDKLFQPSI